MNRIFIVFLAVLFTAGMALGDSFQDEVKKLAEDNAKGYLTPFATAFGTNMNSGLFHRAKTHSVLGFDVSVKAMIAFVPDADLEYDFQIPSAIPVYDPTNPSTTSMIPTAGLFPAADLVAPTVWGGDGHQIEPDLGLLEQLLWDSLGIPIGTLSNAELQQIANQAAILVPPGIDLTTVPLFMPQVSVGLPMKTEVMLRLIPKTKINEDVGNLSLFGFGIKHNVSQYIPMFPITLAGQFTYQSLKVGDAVKSSHISVNVIASKSLMLITPYVGIGYEKSSISVDYLINDPTNPLIDGTPVKFDLDGENGFRGRVGFTLNFLLLGLNADYAIGKYNALTLGLIFSFR